MGLKYTKSWEKFIKGRWTNKKPTKPGIYPLREYYQTENEFPQKFLSVKETKIGWLKYNVTGQYLSSRWEGWYWSEPLPNLQEVYFVHQDN